MSQVMLIPVILLWEVRLKRSRKFALAGVFILVIVSMIFAIVRTTAVSADNARLPDSSWLYMWSTTETCVGKQVGYPCFVNDIAYN